MEGKGRVLKGLVCIMPVSYRRSEKNKVACYKMVEIKPLFSAMCTVLCMEIHNRERERGRERMMDVKLLRSSSCPLSSGMDKHYYGI